MITLRKSDERGRSHLGWLDSRHTFSFADYYDPRFMGFRTLRVLNQDRVQGGHGFPMHSHREFEIISYVLAGSLEHQDTMGSRSVVGPGEAQIISAGTGMAHSEFNPSPSAPVHFLQMWIEPADAQRGQQPVYGQVSSSEAERRGRLRLMASGDGRDGALRIRQDADMYVTRLEAGEAASLPLRPGRAAWVHVATGSIDLNGETLGPGDSAAVEDEGGVHLAGRPGEAAEVVVFDLA